MGHSDISAYGGCGICASVLEAAWSSWRGSHELAQLTDEYTKQSCSLWIEPSASLCTFCKVQACVLHRICLKNCTSHSEVGACWVVKRVPRSFLASLASAAILCPGCLALNNSVPMDSATLPPLALLRGGNGRTLQR